MVRGSNPGGGDIFCTHPDGPLCPTNFLYNGYRVVSGVKAAPPLFSAEVKEIVELYLYSLSVPSWPVLGWTLPLTLCFKNLLWHFAKSIVYEWPVVKRVAQRCLRLSCYYISSTSRLCTFESLIFINFSEMLSIHVNWSSTVWTWRGMYI
jgi:hypothetical protein